MIIDIDIGYSKSAPLYQNLNLEVGNSRIINIIGENGAGKSTFYKTLIGSLKPLRGEIPHQIKHHIAIVAPYISMPGELTVKNVLDLLDAEKIQKAQQLYPEITEYIKRFEQQKIKTLSTGQSRIAEIFTMLANEKSFIVLDEAENGLDVRAKRILLDQVKSLAENHVTVFHTSHNLEDVVYLGGAIYILDKYHGKFHLYEGEHTVEQISSFMSQL